MTDGYREWRQDALCVDHDPELRFPHPGRDGLEDRRTAQRICAECPVRRQCATEALTTDQPFGIWGGLTDRERTKLLGLPPPCRRVASDTSAPKPHGTDARYAQHRRDGEQACEACRAGHAKARAIRTARRRARGEAGERRTA